MKVPALYSSPSPPSPAAPPRPPPPTVLRLLYYYYYHHLALLVLCSLPPRPHRPADFVCRPTAYPPPPHLPATNLAPHRLSVSGSVTLRLCRYSPPPHLQVLVQLGVGAARPRHRAAAPARRRRAPLPRLRVRQLLRVRRSLAGAVGGDARAAASLVNQVDGLARGAVPGETGRGVLAAAESAVRLGCTKNGAGNLNYQAS